MVAYDRVKLAAVTAAVAAMTFGTGCGSAGNSAGVTVPFSQGQVPIASGSHFTLAAPNGLTFTVTLGNGVPAGETATVQPMPPPPPCRGTGCTSVPTPLGGFTLVVQPQPLPVDALVSLALSGVPGSNDVSPDLYDNADLGFFTRFDLIGPSGGPLSPSGESARPLQTLLPSHMYTFAIYETQTPAH